MQAYWGEVIGQIPLEPGMLYIPAVLIFLGWLMKQSEIIPDRCIPLLITAAGIGFGLAIVGANAGGVIQGIGAAGVAVLAHQTWKQTTEKK